MGPQFWELPKQATIKISPIRLWVQGFPTRQYIRDSTKLSTGPSVSTLNRPPLVTLTLTLAHRNAASISLSMGFFTCFFIFSAVKGHLNGGNTFEGS